MRTHAAQKASPIATLLLCIAAAGCHGAGKDAEPDYPHPADPTPVPEPAVGDKFFGTLNGQLTVGPSGAATYSVPISIPPSTAGMAPNLSLVYSSQGSDGIAGQGWSLTGLSMIHRCPRTRIQDSVARQVHMNASDQAAETESNIDGLCLDGKRLFERGSGVYETESKDFSTITRYAQPGSATVSATYFTVVTKAGETRYYGARPNAAVSLPREDDSGANPAAEIAIWALDRVMDAWGNYYDVHYNHDDPTTMAHDGLLVTEIDYTGRVSGSAPNEAGALPSQSDGPVSPTHSITFDYDVRPDVRHLRFRSSTLPLKYRLKAITTPLGAYSLTYLSDDDPMLPSRLAGIDYCTIAGCLEPLDFDWDGGGFAWEPVPHAADVGQEQSYELPDRIDRRALDYTHVVPQHGTQFVDLNGDGLIDFVGQGTAWENNGHGWTARSGWVLPANLSNADGSRAPTLLADVDGDGLLDLVSSSSAGSCTLSGAQRLCVWLNRIKQSGGWVLAPGFATVPNAFGVINLATTNTLADMNGDGLADLVYISGGTEMRVASSTGTGWTTPSQSYDTTPIGPTSGFHLEDLNRDGLPDLVTTNAAAATHVAGINTGANTINGTVWERTTFQVASSVTPPAGGRAVGDIDGDGFYDPVTFYTKLTSPLVPDPVHNTGNNNSITGKSSIALATGLGYTTSGTDGFLAALANFGPDPAVTSFPDAQLPNYLFAMADLNGDGLADLILGHPDGGQVLINTGTTWRDVNGLTTRQASAGPRGVPVVPTENPSFASVGATFIDLDGDGITDLAQSQGNLPGGRITGSWLNKFRPPVINKFPNGLARKTEVSYAIITTAEAKAQGIYQDTATLAAGTTYLSVPLRVVASVSSDDGLGLGALATTSYQYSSLRGSAAGRGPQGFQRIWSEDPAGITTSTTYAQAYPYTGLPTSVTRYKSQVGGGITLTTTATVYCDAVLATGLTPACSPLSGASYAQGTSVFVYPLTITDSTRLLNGLAPGGDITTVTQLRYDDQGNPASTAVTTTASTGEAYQKQTVNSYGAAGSPEQRLGKLTRSVVTTHRLDVPSAAIAHTTEFEYGEVSTFYPTPGVTRGSTLGLQKKKVEPNAGTPIELHTAYTYDRFGNVATTTSCADDFAHCAPDATSSGALPFRTTRVSYDPKDFRAPRGSGLVGSLDYSKGRFPVKTTNALGHVEYAAYDGETGALVQKTGPNGISTCYAYDTFGRETSETARCGSDAPLTTTTDQYLTTDGDPTPAKVVTVTRPPTGATSWVYSDALGRKIVTRGRSFDGGFTEAVTSYDTVGRVATESKPRLVGSDPLYLSAPQYDSLGRVFQVTQDLGSIDGSDTSTSSVVTTTYLGATVQTDHVVNGQHEQRSETKNVLGKVASVKDANGAAISYAYDADGNLTDTTDPGSNVVHVKYDLRGRKLLTRDPDLGEWSYVYDGFGDLLSETDAKGQTVTMTYDGLGRMTGKADASGTAQWIYDVAPGAGIGKLAAMVSAPDARLARGCTIPHITLKDGKRAGRSFSYTDAGDLKEEVDCTDGDSFSTEYEYDDLGRQSLVRYPTVKGGRFAVGYHYTNLGFLYYLTDETDRRSILWTATAMNALGQVTAEQTRNGVETVSTRNPATGWLMAATTTAHAADGDELIQNWAYQYDQVGNQLGRWRAAANGAPASQEMFTYDALNRLLSSDVTIVSAGYDVAESYGYDALGNLTRKSGNDYAYSSGCLAGTRAAGPHAVCSVGSGAPFVYDANGNMVSGNDRTVAYNACNKPIHIAAGAGGGTAVVDFVYGADGNRIVQDVAASTAGSGTSAAHTVYVGLGGTGKSLYERTTRGSTVEHVHFLYAGSAHSGNAFAVRTVTDAVETKYYHFDHLGSVTAVTDESGRVEAAAAPPSTASNTAPTSSTAPISSTSPNADLLGFDPWGARRAPEGRPADPATLQPPAGHREFTSHETIPGLGLINMNGRVYAPSLGRFLSPDPNIQFIADLQSYNRYSYVQNNPLRYTDPTGYFLGGGFDIFIESTLALASIAICPVTGGAGCTVAFAFAGAIYSTASMINAGASWEQAITVNAVGMLAGTIGGQLGAGLGSSLLGGPAGQILGGAVGGALSAAMTTGMFGGSLGKNMLTGAAQGAAWAAVGWAAAAGGGLSQASAGGGEGTGESVAEARTREQEAGMAAARSSRLTNLWVDVFDDLRVYDGVPLPEDGGTWKPNLKPNDPMSVDRSRVYSSYPRGWAFGLQLGGALVAPLLGGGATGINLEYFSDGELALFSVMPSTDPAAGFAHGVDASVNFARGPGTATSWEGPFVNFQGSIGLAGTGYFTAPPGSGSDAWTGASLGVGAGIPFSLTRTTTNYHLLFTFP